MSAIDVLVFVLLALFCYVLVWALVDRICKCCEKCTYLKAFGEFTKNEENAMSSCKKDTEDNKND